jgi:hypothetical protein
MRLELYRQILNIMFNENPSGGSGVVPCGRTDEKEERDTKKSVYAFFAI